MRTIQSPNVEINELDRSAYGRTDYSLPNAPAVLQFGFSDIGENYNIQWINTTDTYVEKYGYPTNEPETYLYNSVCELLERGAVPLVCKLPYDNNSLEKYNFVEYSIGDISAIGGYGVKIDGKYETLEELKQTLVQLIGQTPGLGSTDIHTVGDMAKAIEALQVYYTGKKIVLRQIRDLKDCLQKLVEIICGISDYSAVYMNDDRITSFMQLECIQNGWSDMDEVDRLMTYGKALKRDRIRVYDISRQKYDRYDAEDGRHFIKSEISGETDVRYTDDFLGIVPVFTSPVNAMFF